MDIKTEIGENKVILLVIPNENYNPLLIKFIKELGENKICYISLNKSYIALNKSLNANKINTKDFYFIDAVTEMIVEPKKHPNCTYLPSPRALTELSLEITKCIENFFSEDIIFLDSLSTLLVYHKHNILSRFLHHLINVSRSNENSIMILSISDKDKDTEFFKEAKGIVDKTITLEP